jgi:hypothetical protein
MRNLLILLITYFVCLTTTVVHADSASIGAVVNLEKYQPGSDFYNLYAGVIRQDGISHPIYWGGARCPTSIFGGPTTTDIELLGDVILAGTDVIIWYIVHSNGYRCFTGLVITPTVI